MSKRNYLDEIKQLQQRGEFSIGYISSQRLLDLTTILETIKTKESYEFNEFYKYLPIATVASLESFSRSTIKSLIDKGSPYFDNLTKLTGQSGLKIDFEILTGLQNKQFTLGEFVSYLLPCSSLSQLIGNISTLLGFDFLEALKQHRPQLIGEYDDEGKQRFHDNYDEIMKSIVRTFELRHIFCHESGNNTLINKEEMETDLNNCDFFLYMSSSFIFSILYENWGISKQEEIELLYKELQIKRDELNQKLKEIRSERSTDVLDKKLFRQQFDKTIRQWQKYSDSKAKLKSSYSFSYVFSQIILLNDYIKSTNDFLEDIDKL